MSILRVLPDRIVQWHWLLHIGIDRSLIVWSRKSFWCIWWAQGSLIAIKPGSRADASTAHSGIGTFPFSLVRMQENTVKHFLTCLWTNFYFCLQLERYTRCADCKGKQNTQILAKHKTWDEHLGWLYRGGFLMDSESRTCMLHQRPREQWSLKGRQCGANLASKQVSHLGTRRWCHVLVKQGNVRAHAISKPTSLSCSWATILLLRAFKVQPPAVSRWARATCWWA